MFALHYLNIASVSVERLVVVSGEGPVESEKVLVSKPKENLSGTGVKSVGKLIGTGTTVRDVAGAEV